MQKALRCIGFSKRPIVAMYMPIAKHTLRWFYITMVIEFRADLTGDIQFQAAVGQ
jgi:hypothetical protein